MESVLPKMSLHHETWLAVCDGNKALLLQNQGDRAFPKLETREVFQQENPPAHLQGTDAPGRTFSSMGSRRSATEQTDFHVQAEQEFLRNFAQLLDSRVRAGDIRDLLLVAPAKSLGILRAALSPATQKLVSGELARDYVKLPLYEIERHLAHIG